MAPNVINSNWLRPTLALCALAGLLGLGGCGGGSGAPNNPFAPAQVFTVLPSDLTAYSEMPTTLTVSGGTAPYSAFSNNQSVLGLTVTDQTVTLLPNTVSADTPVTVTVRDAKGATVAVAVIVKAASLVNSLTLKADAFNVVACPNPGALGSSPTDAKGQTFICTGQTGSVAVRLLNTVGGGISGRKIQFDVIQGHFHFFTNAPGQPETFALSYAVPSDQDGNAVARVRADPSAPQEIVIVQASDVTGGACTVVTTASSPAALPAGTCPFVRGVFVIVQVTAGGAALEVVPNTVTITGPDTQTCSFGVATTFFVFGGTPPYTVSNPFPNALQVSPSVVTSSGAGFTVTTLGACLAPATLSISDAAGHVTTVTVNNNVGTTPPATLTTPIPITVMPATIPTLACGANTGIVATGGGTITTQGNTQTTTPATTLFLSVSSPDILTALPSSIAPGAAISLHRQASGSGPAVVQLFVSDGKQVLTVNVPVQSTCP
jgi:hypothetical protein